jgi:hypothetical protein
MTPMVIARGDSWAGSLAVSQYTDRLRVMWDRTPFPVMTTGVFAPHSSNNVYIIAKRLRAQSVLPGRRAVEPELRTILVGSGAALEALIECAGRDDICQHVDQQFELVAFSCFVGDALREGTERFLAEDLAPILSGQSLSARTNKINLPAVEWARPGAKPAPLRKAG